MITANIIYQKYVQAYKKETQGCCLFIADKIWKQIGGDVVARELTWYESATR